MHLLISAGPTREHLDPIRFISNRSTGKMGFALAEAAVARGHEVTLVAGPVSLTTPAGVRRLDVVSALDMLDTLRQHLSQAQALIMSAAVADWRPAKSSGVKLKKRQMQPMLTLAPNPDILQALAPLKGNRLFIGFAAETGDPLPEAHRKLHDKQLDLIVANDISLPDAGFAVDTNRVTLLEPKRPPAKLPLLSKQEVAVRIIGWIEKRVGLHADNG